MFLVGVNVVRQLDDTRLFWRAEIAGKEEAWEAEITEQEPDRVIAWRSISGAPNGGRVTFQPLDANRTLVTLRLEYEPRDPVEKAGEALGVVERQVKEDLQRFKEFVESRGSETGAWRGEIHGGQVEQHPNQ